MLSGLLLHADNTCRQGAERRRLRFMCVARRRPFSGSSAGPTRRRSPVSTADSPAGVPETPASAFDSLAEKSREVSPTRQCMSSDGHEFVHLSALQCDAVVTVVGELASA